MPRPQYVAVIGAGVSGVATAAHLRAAGINVVVFERAGVAGGVWVYDASPAQEPQYPAMKPSAAELSLTMDGPTHGTFAPPGPCYEGLKNNVPTTLLRMTLNAWQDGTEDIVPHQVVKKYIQDTAMRTGVHEFTLYNTRVDAVFKSGCIWQVNTTTLQDGRDAVHRNWHFDAVVVASGHYHACKVPDIPGLANWKLKWPLRIQHSKSYRSAENYRNQNVLLVGAGTSSMDVARELGPIATKVYQLSRGGPFDFSSIFLPPNAERIVDSIAEFHDASIENVVLAPSDRLPGTTILKSGRRLTNIHRIILCTGYHFCLPFLSQYHEDDTPVEKASKTVLVTDGTQMHNLHKDIFYIPDPTLAFIGVPFYTATFTLFEFQAVALAAVWSGRADLPSTQLMEKEYLGRIQTRGVGRNFHSLRGVEAEYVQELMASLNGDVVKRGGTVLEGHTVEWHTAYAEWRGTITARQEAIEKERGTLV